MRWRPDVDAAQVRVRGGGRKRKGQGGDEGNCKKRRFAGKEIRVYIHLTLMAFDLLCLVYLFVIRKHLVWVTRCIMYDILKPDS